MMTMTKKGVAHKTTHLAEYQQLCQQQITGAAAEAGWHDKMKRYLENPFPEVNEDNDLVKLWEVHPLFVFHGLNY